MYDICVGRRDAVRAGVGGEDDVDPDDKDANPGTKETRQTTFDDARDAVRAAKQPPTVWLTADTYRLAKTLVLDECDGTTCRALPGVTVRMTGSEVIRFMRAALRVIEEEGIQLHDDGLTSQKGKHL